MRYWILIIFFSCAKFANAQSATDAIAEDSANVVIIKDARLDALDKRPAALQKALDEAIAAKSKKKVEELPVFNPIRAGNETVTGSIIQRDGFRIMIYNGPDRVAAMKYKADFNKRFPGVRSYMSYNVPNFKIKVGDFADKKEANNFMKALIKMFPQSSLAPDIVTVKNIVIQ